MRVYHVKSDTATMTTDSAEAALSLAKSVDGTVVEYGLLRSWMYRQTKLDIAWMFAVMMFGVSYVGCVLSNHVPIAMQVSVDIQSVISGALSVCVITRDIDKFLKHRRK